MSNRELVKLSDDLETLSAEFANTYTKLISKFEKYTSAPEIVKLKGYWDTAVGLLGKRGTVIEMVDYFIKYKDLILAEKVTELLEIDYAKEIKPGTQADTQRLIIKLIDIFKLSWIKANVVDQTLIKTYISTITLKSISIKEKLIKINNM
jgi:hypothetical protein